MRLKRINIDLQLKLPGLWLKIGACVLRRRRRESKKPHHDKTPNKDQRP